MCDLYQFLATIPNLKKNILPIHLIELRVISEMIAITIATWKCSGSSLKVYGKSIKYSHTETHTHTHDLSKYDIVPALISGCLILVAR